MGSSQGSTDVAGFPGESSTRRQAMYVDYLPLYVKQLIAGGSAGAFAKTAVAPLGQIKMCFQFTSEVSHYQSFKKVWKHGGVSGFYRGNGAFLLRIVPYSALHFMTYEQYRPWIMDNFSALGTGPVFVDLLAGSASGVTAVLCTYPLYSARATLSNPVYTIESLRGGIRNSHKPPEYILLKRALSGLYEQQGLRGLYRGVGQQFIRTLPFAGLKFCVYETLKRHVPEEHQKSILVNLSCGAFAGLFAQTFVQPLAVVRHTILVGHLRSSLPAGTMHKNAWAVLATIVRHQGWQQLFAGLSTNLIAVVPSVAIGFTAYDMTKSWLNLPRQSSARVSAA